jgi:aspartate/tyrosine/aromatic aminotransferase
VNFPDATVYLSTPTWGNHPKIIGKAGLKTAQYRYYKAATRALDFEGMMADLSQAKAGSIILLHACAHNPTGVDPNKEQWAQVADLCVKNNLIPFFDSAYQGYATGDLANDAAAVRIFDSRGLEMLIAQSFSKNLGLYGERVGCATIVCRSAEQVKPCLTQLEAVIRPMYSNPPRHGAHIVERVLGEAANYAAWVKELKLMSGRILDMRERLRGALEKMKTPGTWNHITDQIGMFTFTGLTAKQVEEVMIKKWHIYLLEDGRISMAGVTSKNVNYIAKAIDDAVRSAQSKL